MLKGEKARHRIKKLYIAAPSDTFKFEYQKCYVNLHLTITCFDDKQSVVTNGNILWLTVKLDSSNEELQVLKTAKKIRDTNHQLYFFKYGIIHCPQINVHEKDKKSS